MGPQLYHSQLIIWVSCKKICGISITLLKEGGRLFVFNNVKLDARSHNLQANYNHVIQNDYLKLKTPPQVHSKSNV